MNIDLFQKFDMFLWTSGFQNPSMFLLQLSVCRYNAHETAWNSSRSIIINIERYKLEVLGQNGNGSGVGTMAPAASLFYSWDEDEDDGTPRTITLDCLLPTGVIVPLRVDKDNTLAEIKEVRVCSHQTKAKKSNNKNAFQ